MIYWTTTLLVMTNDYQMKKTMTQVLLPASSLLQLQSVREVPLMTIAIMLMIV